MSLYFYTMTSLLGVEIPNASSYPIFVSCLPEIQNIQSKYLGDLISYIILTYVVRYVLNDMLWSTTRNLN